MHDIIHMSNLRNQTKKKETNEKTDSSLQRINSGGYQRGHRWGDE